MQPIRLACVSFLNTKPLIAGLEHDPTVRLNFAVPSALLAMLADGTADVALLPTIDYQALPDLRAIPSGGIGCDGPTLTVRLFAHVPIDRVTRVACDTDSHTSVALAKILFANHFHADPSFVPLGQASGGADEALLLIGDKVISSAPGGFDIEIDLGDAWKQMTGLPFVFAIWTARPDVELADLPQRLAAARSRGMASIQEIVEKHGPARGWPSDIAIAYLTQYLKFEIGPGQLEAIRLFHHYADRLGLLSCPLRPLRLANSEPVNASKTASGL